MNFCIKCGNQLKPNARFCGKCGEIVLQDIPSEQSQIAASAFCISCGNSISPGIKFCTVCGTPVPVTPPSTTFNAPLPFAPQEPNKYVGIQEQKVQKSPKKKGKAFLIISLSVITIICLVCLGLYFFGIYKPNSEASLAALYADEKYDPVKIDSAANVVENIFATSDTIKLARILSPSSLEKRRQYFSELLPHMSAFANDFKTRKLLYATARFAVYEFTSDGSKYTAEFCLGDNGKWLLMSF
jgi:uncharacterized membrane protein YvbJ